LIYIDPRVGSGHLLSILGNMGLPVSIRDMQFGDVAYDLRGPDEVPIPVGHEVKRLSDLLACIVSKRYCGYQLPGLCRTYKIRYLDIEGVWDRGPGTNGLIQVPRFPGDRRECWVDHPARMQYTDVLEWLTGIEVQTKTHIRFTDTTQDTAYQIFAAAKYAFKSWDEHDSLNVFYEPEELASGVTFSPITRRRRFAALLPGVGWEKSKGAAEVFGSIGEMANAVAEDWTKVEYGKKRRMKIGLQTAKDIVKAIWERERV